MRSNSLRVTVVHSRRECRSPAATMPSTCLPRSPWPRKADIDRAWNAACLQTAAARCVPVAEFGRVRWIDDSKATNVGVPRCTGRSGRRRAPAGAAGGGLGKGADFRDCAKVAGSVHALVPLRMDPRSNAVGDLYSRTSWKTCLPRCALPRTPALATSCSRACMRKLRPVRLLRRARRCLHRRGARPGGGPR